MTRSLIYSLSFHTVMILLTVLSLPFMTRQPVDLPPIISVELIQISDTTNIPFAPKARKVIEKVKEEEKRVVSEQAPPSAKAKEKPDRIPMPNEKKEKNLFPAERHHLSLPQRHLRIFLALGADCSVLFVLFFRSKKFLNFRDFDDSVLRFLL